MKFALNALLLQHKYQIYLSGPLNIIFESGLALESKMLRTTDLQVEVKLVNVRSSFYNSQGFLKVIDPCHPPKKYVIRTQKQ